MIIKLFSLPETFHERNVGTLFSSDYEHFEVLEHAKCKLFELHENHFKRKAWNYIWKDHDGRKDHFNSSLRISYNTF